MNYVVVYIKMIGGKGAKYGFVGVKNGGKQISTFHIKTAKYVNTMILKTEAKGKKIENYILTYNKDFSSVNDFPNKRVVFRNTKRTKHNTRIRL